MQSKKDWKKSSRTIIETYKSIWIPQIEDYIDTHIKQGQKPATPPELITAVTMISLYESTEELCESSRRIEAYSKGLFWLTVVLAFLTAGLIIRTFLP